MQFLSTTRGPARGNDRSLTYDSGEKRSPPLPRLIDSSTASGRLKSNFAFGGTVPPPISKAVVIVAKELLVLAAVGVGWLGLS